MHDAILGTRWLSPCFGSGTSCFITGLPGDRVGEFRGKPWPDGEEIYAAQNVSSLLLFPIRIVCPSMQRPVICALAAFQVLVQFPFYIDIIYIYNYIYNYIYIYIRCKYAYLWWNTEIYWNNLFGLLITITMLDGAGLIDLVSCWFSLPWTWSFSCHWALQSWNVAVDPTIGSVSACSCPDWQAQLSLGIVGPAMDATLDLFREPKQEDQEAKWSKMKQINYSKIKNLWMVEANGSKTSKDPKDSQYMPQIW